MASIRFVVIFLTLCVSVFAQERITYTSSNEIFPNPERGFFSGFPRSGGISSTNLKTRKQAIQRAMQAMEAIRAKGQSIVSLGYNLKKFRNSRLSNSELSLIESDFRLVREGGMKCLIRFDYSGSIGDPDAPLKIVLEHIAQLKPILRANYDVIAVMQAGFIGAWGEWHSSTNGLDNVTDRRKILFAELNALPKVRMVQLRTPHFKQEIFNRTTPISRSEAFDQSKYSRVGEHNDCFLANWNDYGTYTDTTAEKKYISQDCKYVPMGGETCNPSSYCECGNAIYQMQRLHWSLLNSGWNPAVYRRWKDEGCLDEVRRRLGYRFELLSGIFDDSLKPGNAFNYTIKLTNVGFAALYNPRDVEIVLKDIQGGHKYVAPLSIDPRFWGSGDTVDISGQIGIPRDMPLGVYTVYLNLPDPAPNLHGRPDYSIRFANVGTWEASSGYNSLLVHLVVNSQKGGSEYRGKSKFRKLNTHAVIEEEKQQ